MECRRHPLPTAETVEISEQNDSLSESSSLCTASATADAFALALTDGAALGSLPLGVPDGDP